MDLSDDTRRKISSSDSFVVDNLSEGSLREMQIVVDDFKRVFNEIQEQGGRGDSKELFEMAL